jgi:integrase
MFRCSLRESRRSDGLESHRATDGASTTRQMGRSRRWHRHRNRRTSSSTDRNVSVETRRQCCGIFRKRLAAGSDWIDDDLIVLTSTGNRVSPSNFDQTLGRLVAAAGVPRLTSHGLRHTAATHMVRQAADAGELRAVADVLGHSPDMLMKTYAHALPDSIRAVADRIASRSMGSPD